MTNNKYIIILFLLLSVSTTVFSQATTISPYSKYGIGEQRKQYFGQNFGMGGVGIGLRSNRNIGFQNPASYSAISATTFDIGYTNNALWLEDGVETQYQNSSYIDHLAFAFPVIKNIWGMSFGAMPYSSIGYDYEEVVNDSIAGDVSYYNIGSGAINKAFLGNAIGIKIDSTSVISAGANAYFLFGAVNYDQKIIFGDLANGYNVWEETDISVADFGFDFGLQYQKSFKNKKGEKFNFTAGATYVLATDLNAERTEILRSFTGNITFGTIKDTISFIDAEDYTVQLPSELGFGVSLEKPNKWLIGLDYKMTDWGSIASNDNLYNYKSNFLFAVGTQIIPKYDGSSYIQRIAYRLGARYTNSYLEINNVDWTEYGITFGIGLPVRKSENSYPRVNIGFEYGNRGTLESGLIKEKFFNFNLGVTINAKWFRKRKYD